MLIEIITSVTALGVAYSLFQNRGLEKKLEHKIAASQVTAAASDHAVCSGCQSTVARYVVTDGKVICKNCEGHI